MAKSEKLTRVQNIIDAWKQSDIETVLEQLHDDVEYHFLVGQRPLSGKEWVKRFLVKHGEGQSDVQWRIVHHAENDDVLMIEAIDDYLDGNGNRVQIPYMGAFEFADGKIIKWRDYLDSAFLGQSDQGNTLSPWQSAFIAGQPH